MFLMSSLVTDVSFMITGSAVMTIFVYKELTRTLEVRNTPVWVLPNIWRLERVKDAKFDMNKKLLNASKQNTRVTAFTVSELLREKQQEGKGE